MFGPQRGGPINTGLVKKLHARFLKEHQRAVDASLKEAGEHATEHVFQHSKFKRRSARSVKDATKFRLVRTKGGKMVRIRNSKMRGGYNVAYGLEYGTKPHKITAKNGRSLAFKSGGSTIFRRSVNHPGTKPYRFLFKATNAAHRYMGSRLRNRLARVAKRF